MAPEAADEITHCDPAHLRPSNLKGLHYDGFTFLLIKMKKVRQRIFLFSAVAFGCRHK